MAVETTKRPKANTSNYNTLTTHYECKENAINELNSLYSRLESFLPIEQETTTKVEKTGTKGELYDISFSGEKASNMINEIVRVPKNYELGVLQFEGYEDSEGYKVETQLDFNKQADDLLELGIREIVYSYLEQ